MNLIKKTWSKHYYSICFFAFLMCYSVVIPGKCQLWQVSDLSLSFHGVDFSMGFCSKILPGAIYNIFFDDVNIFKVSAYETVLLILLFTGVSVILEKFISNLPLKHQKTGVIISMFLVTGPITFSNYVNELGMLDVYWIFLTALFIVFLSKKELYFLLIPVCMCAIMVHFSSAFSFVPLFFFLMLYKIACITDAKEKKFLCIVFTTAIIASVLLAIYFVVFETKVLTYTQQEFREIMLSRGVPESHLYYYEYAFYGDGSGYIDADQAVLDITMDSLIAYLLYVVKSQFVNTIILHMGQFASGDGINSLFILILVMPIVIFIFKAFSELIKNNKENKIKTASLVFMMIMSFVPMIVGFFTSTDLIRWISHSFFSLFIFFVYVLHNEGEDFRESVSHRLSGIPLMVLGSYFLVYAITCFEPYSM